MKDDGHLWAREQISKQTYANKCDPIKNSFTATASQARKKCHNRHGKYIYQLRCGLTGGGAAPPQTWTGTGRRICNS